MPKQSDKKRIEREQAQAKLKTDVREKKPFENYLGFVKQMNDRSGGGKSRSNLDDGSTDGKKLAQVTSLPNLHPRNLQSEQKITPPSPLSKKPESTRAFKKGRASQPFKVHPTNKPGNDLIEDREYDDWQKS